MASTLSLASFPKAILHIDADAFFASCEQARDPRLKGRIVVTGKERGIASAVSYEGKAQGIKRGMTIQEIRRICPDVVHLPSDYETYSLYSARMFSIVRDHTNLVEEYSIDECFAELTGLRRSRRQSYPQMAAAIKRDLDLKLGMTFSIGLAPSKVVAKIASKWKKPSGLTVISGRHLPEYLSQLPIGDVWGIGKQTAAYLSQYAIRTALDFAQRDEGWVQHHLTKPHTEIWKELRGESVLPLESEPKTDYKSVSKMKTFTPPSNDRSFVFGQLSKNLENACIKIRRYSLVARKVYFVLRTHDFRHHGYEITMSRATAFPNEILRVIAEHFDQVFKPGTRYRLSGVVLTHLVESKPLQLDLFDGPIKVEEMERVYESIDELDKRYGKHTVFLGSSMPAMTKSQHGGERGEVAARRTQMFRGETERKRLGIPMLGDV